MRYLFWFWFFPMAIVWSWIGLSYYDMSFGMSFLSRKTHDFVFNFYGYFLGIERTTIYLLLLRACVVDTLIIFGIFAYRRREKIKAWWAAKRGIEPVQEPSPAPAE